MPTSERLRLLFLDDNPSFIDSATHCLSFRYKNSDRDRALYEANFSLGWMYNFGQAVEFFDRLQFAQSTDPRVLLSQAAIPHLFLFDYAMTEALLTERALKTQEGALEHYQTHLDPLAGTWGLGPVSEDDPRPRKAWVSNKDTVMFEGFVAGTQIAVALKDFACVGIPQTVHKDPPSTRSMEWLLDQRLKGAFKIKNGTLPHWQAFFDKALPLLREQLVEATRRGTLTPNVKDILAAVSTAQNRAAFAARTLRFESALGLESLRCEALFFDCCYRRGGENELVAGDEQRLVKEVGAWTNRLLNAALGPLSNSEVSEALRLADRYRAAHADPLHYRRRQLSRELTEASAEEYEAVVAQNEPFLRALGLSPSQTLAALQSRNLNELKIAAELAPNFGTLQTITKEARGNSTVARYAAIALAVWAEAAWIGAVEGDFDVWLPSLAELINSDQELARDLLDRALARTGISIPAEKVAEFEKAVLAGTLTPELARTVGAFDSIGRLNLFNYRLEGSDGSTWVTAGGAIEAKHAFIRDIMAPAPDRLLMWRDSGTAQGDVDKPLERLDLKITSLLEGTNADKGLQPGEGRLIRVAAAHYGFAKQYWPKWMREGVMV